MIQTQYENPFIHKAFAVLERLSADEETRHIAEAREKGREEGEKELQSLLHNLQDEFNAHA